MAFRENKDSHIQCLVREGYYSSERSLRNYSRYLFKGVGFEGKKVLDVGGGTGLFSFLAGSRGAARVICLEPELSGSGNQIRESFTRMQSRLGIPGTECLNTSFQDFSNTGDTFDIILLHNSINHLDENACARLHYDEESRDIYRNIFRKLNTCASPGATVIICDCARTNFWAGLGLQNPFNPTIEWHKHQNPGLWTRLLLEAGFKPVSLKWSSFSRLGLPGRLLFGNPLAAFFTLGHFRLELQKI